MDLIVTTMTFRQQTYTPGENVQQSPYDDLVRRVIELNTVWDMEQEIFRDVRFADFQDLVTFMNNLSDRGKKMINIIPVGAPPVKVGETRILLAFFHTREPRDNSVFSWRARLVNTDCDAASIELLRSDVPEVGNFNPVLLGLATLPLTP